MKERRDRNEMGSNSEFIEKVIGIDRVNKVVKGGKRLAFRAFIIVGDGKGRVGLALGKSKEVPSAIRKAVDRAKKTMVTINVVNGTVPHEIIGKFGASRVLLKPARQGTGVIAGGSIRALLEALGLSDVVAKSLGSRNKINMAKAALDGLCKLKKYDDEVQLRERRLSVLAYREVPDASGEAGVAIKNNQSASLAPKRARTKLAVAE